MRQLVNKTLW